MGATHFPPARRKGKPGERCEPRATTDPAKGAEFKLQTGIWLLLASCVFCLCGIIVGRGTWATIYVGSGGSAGLLRFHNFPHPHPSTATSRATANASVAQSRNPASNTTTSPLENELTKITNVSSGQYDFGSAPAEALEFARKWISTDPACEHDPKKLQVACCRAHCGGFSDRTRGLLILTLVAAKTGR